MILVTGKSWNWSGIKAFLDLAERENVNESDLQVIEIWTYLGRL